VSLQDWLKNGWLVEHRTSPQEIEELLGLADRDLIACQTPGLGTDWQFSIAYNAALQSANAALAASGYRTAREAHHYRIIQSLAFTIGADSKLVEQFDRFRKKRHITGYRRAGAISDFETNEMFNLAKALRQDVEGWLHVNHPELLGE